MKKILTILSLVAIVQCSNVRAEWVEVVDRIDRHGVIMHNWLRDTKGNVLNDSSGTQIADTKEVSDILMKACDDFHDNVVINENANPELAKQQLQVVITEFNKVANGGHNINFVEITKVLFAAGALIGGISANELLTISPDLKAFYGAGALIGKSALCTEIQADRLIEILKSSSIAGADLAINKLQDQNYAFDSFSIPIAALQRQHKERGNKSNAEEAEDILKNTKCTWIKKWQDPENVTENIVSMAREVGKEVLEFGNGKQMVSRLTPKEIVGNLEEGEKVSILMMAAMAYLLENPMATARDAVEAGAKRVKGENRANILGTTEEARKKDAVAWLEMAGRPLCQLGRFIEQVQMVVKINKNIKSIAFGGKAKDGYVPMFGKRVPANFTGDGTINLPIRRLRCIQINVAGDGSCGFYSAGCTREYIKNMVYKNYPESDPILAPSKFVGLPGHTWLTAPNLFVKTVVNPTVETYGAIIKDIDNIIYIAETDFMYLANTLQRGMWIVITINGKYRFDSPMYVFPIETNPGSNSRATPKYIWNNYVYDPITKTETANHFNALVPANSYTELATMLRHRGVGIA